MTTENHRTPPPAGNHPTPPPAGGYQVRRICAWCNTVMGHKISSSPHDTHGMCPECARDLFGEELMSALQTEDERRAARQEVCG